MTSQQQFYDCMRAVKSLRPGAGCRYELNEQLELLLKCRLHSSPLPPSQEEIEDVLLTCIRLVTPSYVLLLSKAAQLVHSFLGKLVVLTRAGFHDVLAFTLTAVETEWTVADGLRALCSLLYRHKHLLSAKQVELLIGQGENFDGLLFTAVSNEDNVDACASAVLCLGLLTSTYQLPAGAKAILSETTVAHAITSIVECLRSSISTLPSNPEHLKLCTSCAKSLVMMWPFSKTAAECHGSAVVNHCKTLLDLMCGPKDPNRTHPVSFAQCSHSSESIGDAGVRGEKASAVDGTAASAAPAFSSSTVNSLKTTGMSIEQGTGDSGRGLTAGRAPRRRKKKKKKKAMDGGDAVYSKAASASLHSQASVVSDDGPSDSESTKLVMEMAQSVLNSASPLHCTPHSVEPAMSAVPPAGDSPRSRPRDAAPQGMSSSSSAPTSFSAATQTVTSAGQSSCLPATSSDSEMSDMESSRKRPNPMQREEDVEFRTLLLLDQVLASLHRKVVFSFWPALFPDATVTSRGPLFSVALASACSKSRMTALIVTGRLLDGSRQYLLLADDSVSTQAGGRAFTPLGQTLGSILREVYEFTLQLLVPSRETSINVIVQAIKCLSLFAWNAPFHRLRPGYLTRIVSALEPFLTRRDVTVRTAALTCLGAVVCVHAPLTEVTEVLRPAMLSRVQSVGPSVRGYGSYRESASDIASSSATDGDGLSDWKVVHHHGPPAPPPPTGTSGMAGASPGLPGPHSSGRNAFSWLALKDRLVDRLELSNSEFPFPASTSWLCRLTIHLIISKELSKAGSSLQPLTRPGLRPAADSVYRQKLVIRTEALQVLLGIVHNYFVLVRDYWRSLVYMALEVLVMEAVEAIHLHVFKLLTTLLQQVGELADAHRKHSSSKNYTGNAGDIITMKELSELWQLLLDTSLLPNLSSEACPANVSPATVRSAALDCLAAVHPAAFNQLDAGTKEVCLNVVKQLCADQDQIVKCSAIRTLGIFLTHPELRKAPAFIPCCLDIVCHTLEEQVLAVRAKGSWTFGNLCEALMRNLDDGLPVEHAYVLRLLAQSMKAASDHDRVKTGAVRAVGCLLRCLSRTDCGCAPVASLVHSAMKLLTKIVASTSITAKVRWNSCYAIRTALSNAALPIGSAEWTEPMYAALLGVAQKHKNFKVRIGAASALLAPQDRAAFGDSTSFQWICNSILNALESCGYLSDFGDLRYKDTLQKQLCIVVLRLISLADNDDGEALFCLLQPKLRFVREVITNTSGKSEVEDRGQDTGKPPDQDDGADGEAVLAKSTNYSVCELLDLLRARLTSMSFKESSHLKQVYQCILEPSGSEEFPFEADYS